MLRKASEITDVGQAAVKKALIERSAGKVFTENEIAGIGTKAMRDAGSNWEWTFTEVKRSDLDTEQVIFGGDVLQLPIRKF